MSLPSFLFGGNTGLTAEQVGRRRKVLDAMALRGTTAPKDVGSGLSAIGNALLYRSMLGDVDAAESAGKKSAAENEAALFSAASPSSSVVDPIVPSASSLPAPGAQAQIAATDPSVDVSQNGSTYSPFIDTIKAGDPAKNIAGITNPNALAAVASTGKSESGWSAKNAGGSWSDPSQSGQPGTAGGVMSWRGPRLQALQSFAAERGEQGNGSPQTQALFFLQESPDLTTALNSAKSPEEAQRLMNNAWAFAGYDKPGGETARRISQANAYLPQFQGQGGQQVASLDPSAGMPPAAAAIEVQAPGSGVVDPNAAPAFDAGRFAPPIKLAEMPASREELPGNLDVQAAAYAAPASRQAVANAMSTLPQQAPQFPPSVTAVGNALAGVQPNAAAAPTLPAPTNVGPAPQVAAAQQAQIAGNFPPAPQPASSGPSMASIQKVLSDPYSSDGAKAYAQSLMEQRVWQQRQDYTRQQQASDPLRQAQVQEATARAKALQTPSRPITADERLQWGIPENDARPYAMTTEGPKLIGSSGQTINVGGQVEARMKAAEALGLTKDDPRYMGYVLGGDMPKESQQNLTAIDKKAVLDALDQVQASKSATDQLQSIVTPGENGQSLNDRAGSGAMANWQSWAARNDPTGFFDDAKGEATTELNNTVLNQALGSLKSIFGAAPTEGERQILLDMQASVDKTPAERKIIIDKAIALAQRRQQFNQERADEIRGNTFYKPKGGQVGTPSAPVAPAAGNDYRSRYGLD
jgi:hypothetical protein